MTYFDFLMCFIGLPIVMLVTLLAWDRRHGIRQPETLRNPPGLAAVGLHSFIALFYTTPWDNYLVAARVWWYDSARVAGITLGQVPIEEYIFIILQPMLTGLWLLWLAPRFASQESSRSTWCWRVVPLLILLPFWLASIAALIGNFVSITYLALILVWALPPIGLQLAFGGDILRRHARWVTAGVLIPTLHLWVADTLAIRAGIWTISSEQTLGLRLPGGLPLEEAVFFLVTNTLIGFGMTLMLAVPSRERLYNLTARWQVQRSK